MTTDEHFDGEVHGLLAGAFGDGVPAVNLVPGAVDGYRRHRRRARVLGAAGGTLALAGVVAAGTALADTATGGAKGLSAAASIGDRTSDRTGAGVPAGSTSPECQGPFHSFTARPGDGVYTADEAGLRRVCGSDLYFLRGAIPNALIAPQHESFAQALERHDLPAGTPLPPGVTQDTQLIVPGSYVVKAGGQTTTVTLMVAHRQGWGFNGCTASSCPPNLTLAGGTPATENPGSAQVGLGALSAHPDAAHWVWFMATAQGTPKATLGFDFAKAIRSEAFAKAVAYDVQNLDVLG